MALFVTPVLRSHSNRIISRMRGSRPAAAILSSPTLSSSKITPLPTTPVVPTAAGWLPQQTLASTAAYPFAISRTASRDLPVYSEFRHGRTKVLTVIRRFSGNTTELARQLNAITHSRVEQRTGRLEIEGDRVRQVKSWLAGLGF